MERVTSVVTSERPLLLTPVFNFFDIEFADDTALVCKTAESMQCLLHEVQREASRWGLHLNESKTVELKINSPIRVRFLDGDLVPRDTSAKYFGTIMRYRGDPTEEVNSRIRSAFAAYKLLKPLWKARGLPLDLRIRVFEACIVPRLTYSLGTCWLPSHLLNKLEA
eukprot:8995975-Alexandrium_andersonii.AAC.1